MIGALRPLRMQHVSLWLVREAAPAASLALAECGSFNPDPDDTLRFDPPGLPEQRYHDAYASARVRLDKILAFCGRTLEGAAEAAAHPVPLEELVRIDARLGEIWNRLFQGQERLLALEEEQRRLRQLSQTLQVFALLDIDLGTLLDRHRFLDVRVGMVPAANVSRLSEALGIAGFVLSAFALEAGTEHCMIIGPEGRGAEIDALLHTAGWQPVELPPELRTHPDIARTALSQRAGEAAERIEAQREENRNVIASAWQEIVRAEAALRLAGPYAKIVEEALAGRGGLVVVSGWVPANDVTRLRSLLDARVGDSYVLKLRDPRPTERPRVPSVVRHPALLRSFAGLVRTYGVPRYGEFDPTLLFALSFVLMFGMMFGDLGQGLTLAMCAFLLRGTLAPARPLLVSAGLSSAVFGVLYGSVFGLDHVLAPVWMSPLSDPARVLVLSIYWGIGFIIVASLIRTWNLYLERGIAAALLEGGGAAGILLYAGSAAGLAGWLRGEGFGYPAAAVALVGTASTLAYNWHAHKGTVAERLVVGLVATLETAIGYFANTLSFMRVGAFSLNHVALALAIFAVAKMVGGTGHWVVLAIGNVVMMVLEGGIVAIQALRLEYYEGFSRFFSADGREFRPLRLGH